MAVPAELYISSSDVFVKLEWQASFIYAMDDKKKKKYFSATKSMPLFFQLVRSLDTNLFFVQ